MNQGSVAISIGITARVGSWLGLVLALTTSLAGCGQRGPLTLPQALPNTSSSAAPASSPASAP